LQQKLLEQVTNGRLILYDEHSRCLSQFGLGLASLLR
jgi:hypothetical protein